jgi:hypothetical protein
MILCLNKDAKNNPTSTINIQIMKGHRTINRYPSITKLFMEKHCRKVGRILLYNLLHQSRCKLNKEKYF